MNSELFLTKLSGIRCEGLFNNKIDPKLFTSLVRFHEMIVKKCITVFEVQVRSSNKMGYITYQKSSKL